MRINSTDELSVSFFDNVIFDLGTVLCDLDRIACVKYFESLGVCDIDSLIGNCSQKGIFGDLEIGVVDTDRFCNEIRNYTKLRITNEDICTAWNAMILGTPVELLELILKLKEKVTVSLLTNVNPIHIDYVQKYNFSQIEGKVMKDFFHHLFLSHELGCRKPDEKIYDIVERTLNTRNERILFLDDNEDNLKKADIRGWSTIKINDTRHTINIVSNMIKQTE